MSASASVTGRQAGAPAANQRPDLGSGRRGNLEQRFFKRLRNPPWNQPEGSDAHHGLVDGEARHGQCLKAGGLRA